VLVAVTADELELTEGELELTKGELTVVGTDASVTSEVTATVGAVA
jgi:hypothetical protein